MDQGRFTRRSFLGSTLAAAAGSSAAWADDKASNSYGHFIVGCQSYCFRNFNVEQALKKTQELGLHFWESFPKHIPVESAPEQTKALLKMCKEYEVTVISSGVHSFTRNHDANRKFFEHGKAFGVKYLSASPAPDSFDSLDKLVEEYKIGIAIHPHGPMGKKMDRWYSAKVILDAVKDHHPMIGSCLDTGHLIRAEQLGVKLDPVEEVLTMGARNFGMHLKDHDNKTKHDVIYGKGRLDVPGVLKAFKQVKFKGYIAVEYEAHPDNPSPDMAACLQILRDAVKTVG